MENRKYGTPHAIGVEKWKQLKQYFFFYNSIYENLDRSEPKEKVISCLQTLYFEINTVLNETIDYLQLKGNLNILFSKKQKIYTYSKDLNILLKECFNELNSLGVNVLIDYDKFYFGHTELTPERNKETSDCAYEIEQEFRNYIKIEALELQELETKEIHQKEKNQFNEIFSNNGFELFNYILENYIAEKGKRGRYADLSFYYWSMYSSNPKYIHQPSEVFKRWFCDKYVDNFEKIRTYDEVSDQKGNRKRHFQTSLDWFKTQK